jgi:hypothetical protein
MWLSTAWLGVITYMAANMLRLVVALLPLNFIGTSCVSPVASSLLVYRLPPYFDEYLFFTRMHYRLKAVKLFYNQYKPTSRESMRLAALPCNAAGNE